MNSLYVGSHIEVGQSLKVSLSNLCDPVALQVQQQCVWRNIVWHVT